MKAAVVRQHGLAQWDVMKIAGEARLDQRTVLRVLVGDPKCEAKSVQLVRDAAARLGLVVAIGDPFPGRIRAT